VPAMVIAASGKLSPPGKLSLCQGIATKVVLVFDGVVVIRFSIPSNLFFHFTTDRTCRVTRVLSSLV